MLRPLYPLASDQTLRAGGYQLGSKATYILQRTVRFRMRLIGMVALPILATIPTWPILYVGAKRDSGPLLALGLLPAAAIWVVVLVVVGDWLA